uniref:Pseudouridine synthase RsuA/RluA-like domain-containing protein n=1 Tax=Eutreptiella gymnastica TaxID=73025 RepID=A0A7S1J2B8_9EUGL
MERRVHKYSCALVVRNPKKKMGTVTGDMAKGRRGSWKLLRSTSSPTPAVTTFVSLPLGTEDGGPPLRLLVLKPKTGKTHQIRVAMKSLGAPVLGDLRYGAALEVEERLYLHACAIRMPALP